MKVIILTLEVSVADEAATIARAQEVREHTGTGDTELPSLADAVADIVNMDDDNDYLTYFVNQHDERGQRGGWSATPA